MLPLGPAPSQMWRRVRVTIAATGLLFLVTLALTTRSKPAPHPGALLAGKTSRVTWQLSSEPEGANVVDLATGQVLGQTPWRIVQPPGTGEQRLQLQDIGFESVEVVFSRNRSEKRHLLLPVKILVESP